MVTLNGRFSQDMDNFTVLSTLGKSVVDYVIVNSTVSENITTLR